MANRLGVRVIVVDVEVDTCRNLSEILLTDLGDRVDGACDAAEAAAPLRDTNVQLAMIDIKLAGSHGTEVCALVRDVDTKIRIGRITGRRRARNAFVARLLAEGADATCSTPFDMPKRLETQDQLTQAQG